MAAPYRDCVLLMGDSLTCGQEVPENLVSRFNAAYYRTLDIVNRGISGYNTTWYLAAMDRMLAKVDDVSAPEIRLITIWFGTNDALLPDIAPGRGISITDFEADLCTMMDHLTSPSSPYAVAHSDTPLSIILITPPSIHEPLLDQPPHLTNPQMERYRNVVLKVGREWQAKAEGQRWKVVTVDLFGLLKARGEISGCPEALYTDGVHLSSEGHGVLWSEIESLVRTDLKGRGIDWSDPVDLPWTVPASWNLAEGKDGAGQVEEWMNSDEGPDGQI